MRTEQPRYFQKSCLALAILSLSACATTDGSSGSAPDSLYERAGAVGKRSMAMSSNAWQHTREALGLNDQGPDALLDEVDLALMEEDAVLPPSAIGRTVKRRPGTPPGSARQASILGEPVLAAAVGSREPAANDKAIDRTEESAADTRDVTIVAANYDETAESDLMYEVTSTDTLWSIARKFTGNPANWQQIAEFNDLSPDASVRAGQELRIQRELLTRDAPQAAATDDVVATGKPTVPTQSASGDAAGSALADSEPAGDDPAGTTPVGSGADAQQSAASDTDSEPFTVQANETLWDLAKRATGDATLWQDIAEHNTLSEQQVTLVQAGQTILVPAELVKAPEDAGAKAGIAETDTGAETAPTTEAVAATASNTATDAAIDDGEDANASATVEAVPATRTSLAAADVTTMDDISDEREAELKSIMVSGTYYPKAVYNKADFSSSLLMRVSPGTALKVAGAEGPWFKVETDKGLGYMHARDIR